jgi:hypothetical protein
MLVDITNRNKLKAAILFFGETFGESTEGALVNYKEYPGDPLRFSFELLRKNSPPKECGGYEDKYSEGAPFVIDTWITP